MAQVVVESETRNGALGQPRLGASRRSASVSSVARAAPFRPERGRRGLAVMAAHKLDIFFARPPPELAAGPG